MLELESFKIHLARTGRRKSTITLYVSSLERLVKHVPSLELPAVEAFLLSLIETGRKGSYANQYVDALRIYGKFIGREDLASIRQFRVYPHIKSTMADSEIEAFLALPPTRNGEKETRNYAVWTLFFQICAFSGMRPGEVANLTVDSVDFGRGVFVLETTKTTPRIVPIAPGLVKSLSRHIETLTGTLLFPSKQNGTYRSNGVFDNVDWSYNFHTRLKRLGIKRKNLSPYSLRHSFITRMLDEDVSLPKVQKIVGHKRIDTTLHYTHLTTKDIVKAMSKDPLSRNAIPVQEKVLMGRKALEDLGHIVIRSELLDSGRIVYETALEKLG